MPRQVKIRLSYASDSLFLSRLIRATELDKQLSKADKKALIEKLSDLSLFIMELDKKRRMAA